ncbi:MAG: hypothetical protein KDJ90_13755 [Nitratireductor sp.]|nr:hypothetical protein [Nitratireductor sp.]
MNQSMTMQREMRNGAENLSVPMEFPASGERQGIEKVLDGLIVILDQERTALNDMARTQFGDLTRQKLQLLVQLNRAVQTNGSIPHSVEEKLRQAKCMLDENAAMLKRRMDAIREVTSLIAKEIRDAESDGTYSVSGGIAGAYRQV